MPQDIVEQRMPTPSVTTGGGAYRATTTGDGDTWLCPHVHFTQQSARRTNTCGNSEGIARAVGTAA